MLAQSSAAFWGPLHTLPEDGTLECAVGTGETPGGPCLFTVLAPLPPAARAPGCESVAAHPSRRRLTARVRPQPAYPRRTAGVQPQPGGRCFASRPPGSAMRRRRVVG